MSLTDLSDFRGKFAQKLMDRTHIIGERSPLLKLLTSPSVQVTSIKTDLGSKLLVNYKDLKATSSNTNVIIAALTTSHARIILYQMLHLVGRNCLMFDTDSVLYKQRRGTKIMQTGNYLGCLTDERDSFGKNSEIIEFCSAGPKNYCLKVKLEDGSFIESRKIKGITLKANNTEQTSMDTLKKLINGEADDVTVKLINKIQRSSGFEVISTDSTKRIRMVYDKRVIIPGTYDSLPWGTKKNMPEVIPDPNIVIPEWEVRGYAA
jgi:hypothetical protein